MGRPPIGGWPETENPVTENFVDTEEFKLAVAEAAKLAARSAVEEFQTELIARAGTSSLGDETNLISRLALAIGEISDQGTSRKRVAPEILAARAAAEVRMVERLMKARADGEKPEYRLISKTWLNERMIEPFRVGADKIPVPTEIIWTGKPNDAMRPINDVAKEIFAEFRAATGRVEAISGADNRPLFVTAGGLIVKGDPPARRTVAAVHEFADDLEQRAPNDPRVDLVHVLGTIHPPARQNALTETR